VGLGCSGHGGRIDPISERRERPIEGDLHLVKASRAEIADDLAVTGDEIEMKIPLRYAG
jgi:hypothetical protein